MCTEKVKGLILILFICFSLFIFAEKAEAHFLLVDGTIGAVLHIDPNDDPYASAPATFNYAFKDTAGKLDLTKCDCTFFISSNGSPIYSGALGSDPNIHYTYDSVNYSFTLPSIGLYTVVVEGKPDATSSVNFQPFKLTYNLRVDKAAAPAAVKASVLAQFFGGHAIHIILFGGAILIAIYIIIRDKRRDKIKGV